jgi:HSP20 family protein
MSDLTTFHNQLDRIFEDMFQRSHLGDVESWYPAVDLLENKDEYTLVAELPGMIRDDVKITLNDNVLTLRGEKKAEKQSKEENWLRIERTYGTFERSFALASTVDNEKVKARFENGVVRITLPKAESSRTREIDID